MILNSSETAIVVKTQIIHLLHIWFLNFSSLFQILNFFLVSNESFEYLLRFGFVRDFKLKKSWITPANGVLTHTYIIWNLFITILEKLDRTFLYQPNRSFMNNYLNIQFGDIIHIHV